MTSPLRFSLHLEQWPLKRPFRIAGREWRTSPALVVEVWQESIIGRGEAQGIFYLDETPETMLLQVEGVLPELEYGASRETLLDLLRNGGARNALDCALWDLEAKRRGKTIWQLLDLAPKPVTTVFTIGLEATPEAMGSRASAASACPLLKVKLDSDRPLERLAAVRKARPDATIVVDANQSWSFDQLREWLPEFSRLDLAMIEQPLARGNDEALEDFRSPILLAADESCLDTRDLESAARRYGMINIKLDKTGGLTEALRLINTARELGLRLMVGNMVGTSLAMAPSFVVAQYCDFVDIDGPLLLKYDRPEGMTYQDGRVSAFASELWG